MKTDPHHISGEPEEVERRPATPLRRVGQVGLSVINPLSDLGVIYRQGVKPTMTRFGQAWTLLKVLTNPPIPSDSLDWEQAVERSGKTIEHLQTTFKRIRAGWWCLMVIGGVLALVLSGMTLFVDNLPTGTMLRIVITILVLAAFGGLGFVKSLIATYRLWQLQERRVSESEGGTFNDFLAENNWRWQVLTLGAVG